MTLPFGRVWHYYLQRAHHQAIRHLIPNFVNLYMYIFLNFLNLNRINFGQRSTLRGAVTIMINSSKISIHRFIATTLAVSCGQRMATLIRQYSSLPRRRFLRELVFHPSPQRRQSYQTSTSHKHKQMTKNATVEKKTSARWTENVSHKMSFTKPLPSHRHNTNIIRLIRVACHKF